MAIFRIPEEFQGKSLSDLRRERDDPFRADILAGQLGIDQNAVFSPNQQLNFSGDPTSAEGQFISRLFTPESTFQEGQQKQQLADINQREGDFLNRFKTEFPEIISGLENELDLPNLRDIAFSSTEALRDVPEQTTEALQGRGVTQNQLERKIAAQQAERAPIAQEATRQAQFAQEEFGRRLGQELTPFEMERELLSAGSAREFDLLKTNIQANLSRELQELSNLNSIQLQEMQNSGALDRLIKQAELEEKIQNIQAVDLGNRVEFVNTATGETVGSRDKGLAPIRGGGSGGGSELDSLFNQFFG